MSEKAHRYLVLASLAALLLGPRLGHLSGPIDDPHSWRQCDTANYAWAFYKEGIDLFRPSVCWMGAHKTVILEFPLHEAVVAVAYRLLGYDLLYARLVTLAFFAGAAVYLFLLVRFLFDRLVAVWATAIYLVLPLGIFYSRAVHIDFCAVGLAHAMLYYWTRGYAENKPPLLAAGTACGVLAFLVKAPYAFYLLLPLGCLVAMRFSLTPRSRSETSQHEGHEAASSPLVPSAVLRALHVLRELRVRHDGARRAACLLAFVAVPLLCFLAWRMHVDKVNRAAPDWFFIPGYFKFVGMADWYYGAMELRAKRGLWEVLGSRLLFEVTSQVGMALFIGGLAGSFFAARRYGKNSILFLWAWLAGCVGYMVCFFKLNVIHNYYQIPLLAVVSVFAALALALLHRRLESWLPAFGGWVTVALYGLLAANSVVLAEALYYQRDAVRESAGALIQANTPENGLVIASIRGTDCRDSRLLYRAKRNGWSIDERDLTSALVDALQTEGADFLAVVLSEQPRGAPAALLADYQAQSFGLSPHPWRLYLARLPSRGH